MYVRPKQAMQAIGCSHETLRRYATDGLIDYLRTDGGHRRYNVASYRPTTNRQRVAALPIPDEEKKISVYARASSKKQKDDLERQKNILKEAYPNAIVFEDMASGINYERKGLTRLLDRVCKGEFKQVVVAHKDRLARFGVELIQWIINRTGTPLLILDREGKSSQQELTEDLMAIVHVFSCRANGKRRYKNTQQQGEKAKKRCIRGKDQTGKGDAQATVRQGASTPCEKMPAQPTEADSKATILNENLVQGCTKNIQHSTSICA